MASPARAHIAMQQAVLGRSVNDQAIAYLFPGVIVLVLAAIAIFSYRPSRERWRSAAVPFYAVLAVLSTLMFVTWPVDLWRHVYWLPGFNFIRVPSRFILVVVLCLGVLAAAAFETITAKWKMRSRLAGAVVLAALLLVEYSSHPFAGVPYRLDIPAADRWLDSQPKPFTVAELPVPSVGDLGNYERSQTRAMLHSTAHWQKTVHGYSGIRQPLHEQLYEVMTRFPDPSSIDALRGVGVTYVVVHGKDYGERWREVEPRLAQSRDLRPVHADGDDRVYAITARVSSATPPSP
jgi:hypothetical protein